MYLVVRKLLTESLQSVSEERQLVQKITKRGNRMEYTNMFPMYD